MRTLLWIALALCAAVLMHARLAAWPVAPDLPLALAAWAAVVGDTRVWMWRVWLAGAVTDVIDPGSDCFHAAAHLALVLALLPTRRWLPGMPWLALLVCGAGLSLAVQGLDILVSGRGGWSAWQGGLDALLTGVAAVLLGQVASAPRRTATVDEDDLDEPVAAEGDQPLRSAGN